MNVGGSKSAKSRDINLNVPAGSEQANNEGQEVGQGEAQPKAVRPPGRKKSKEKKRGEGDDEYMGMIKNFLEIKTKEHAIKKEMWANEKNKEIEDNRKLDLEERKLDIEHRRLIWEQEKKIMFCDVTQMDEHQRAYVRVRRAELAKEALVNANVGETASGESFV
jgi:ribosomal protein S8E